MTSKEEKEKKELISLFIDTSPEFVYKALETLYNLQTESEQETELTIDINHVGFTGVDAPLLTSFAKQYLKWRDIPEDKRPYKYPLSYKQYQLLKEKLKKYYNQIHFLLEDGVMNDKKIR